MLSFASRICGYEMKRMSNVKTDPASLLSQPLMMHFIVLEIMYTQIRQLLQELSDQVIHFALVTHNPRIYILPRTKTQITRLYDFFQIQHIHQSSS